MSVPRVASAATWARAHAHGEGLSRTHQHTAPCPLKGLRDPEDDNILTQLLPNQEPSLNLGF